MDRNSIIGIVLIAAIFVVFGIVNKPSEEERKEIERRRLEQIALDSAQKAKEKESLKLQTENQESLVVNAESGAPTQEIEYYTLENDKIKLTLSSKGGRPYAVELKEYQTWDSLPLILFDGDSTRFELFTGGVYPIKTGNWFFNLTDSTKSEVLISSTPETLTLRTHRGDGKYIDYSYSLSPDSYQVDLQIEIVGMKNELSTSSVNLAWSYFSPTQEKSWKNEVFNTTMYYKHFNDDVDFFNPRANKTQVEEVSTRLEWLAYKDQFFSSVLMTKQPFEGASMEINKLAEDGPFTKRFDAQISLADNTQGKFDLSFYFGPNDFKFLKKQYEAQRLHEIVAVGRGIIKWINQGIIINLFFWLNKYFVNYGIIILLMTIIIKLFLLPLTFRSYMSQAKMRVVKPMVDEATKKIPKEKAMEKQQATMAIYKKVGVSPLGGCLPMILQMPILFAMFRFFPGSIELRQESFLWATDLSTYDDLIRWSGDIPIITKILGNHLSLFTLLMTITTIISMKTNSSAQMQDSSMPGMKTMMYIMPVTFLFVLNDFSAGLTYYYFLANVITFAQNFLFKRMINEAEVLKKLEAKKAKPKKKSKWQQRIEEMQKAQQAAAKKRR